MQLSPPSGGTMSTKKKTPKQAKARNGKQAKPAATKNGKGLGPVAQVWQIATKLGLKAERKEVLAACVAAGIHPATAATQYYRWKHASPAQRTVVASPPAPTAG